jgi:hypothetical protein
LIEEWHPTKNGSLVPSDFTSGANTKVWWKCPEGPDHEWQAIIYNRANNGSGCPICSNHKVVGSNCLSNTHPEIASKWHPSKNGSLTPKSIHKGSSKKVWWLCPVSPDHEFKTSVCEMEDKRCPMCAGKKIVRSNSLATLNPKLTREWHPTKNHGLTPNQIAVSSGKKVWWLCSKYKSHEWEATPANRKVTNCPFCSGQVVSHTNSLATLYPEIATQWHPTKNKSITALDVVAGTNKVFWWKCANGDDHEWRSSVYNRTKIGAGCPICSNRKVVQSNCLATTHPEVAKKWHTIKNGALTPWDVTKGSHKRVWWKCEKGDDHIFKAQINTTSEETCPVCDNKIAVLSNALSTTNPELAKQWHPVKNGELKPSDVVEGSGLKVWWQCSSAEDHVWKTSVDNRKKTGCPFCSLTPQSKQELTITFELKTLFPRIDPKGFKTSVGGKLKAIDIFIPVLNLCIEFDGSYWHKDKSELDKIKSELLLNDGFQVIRVREEPLVKIHSTDVISKKPYNGKQVTNDILSMILIMYKLDEELVNRIKHYQSVRELQNEMGLNKYIEKILKEKANQ